MAQPALVRHNHQLLRQFDYTLILNVVHTNGILFNKVHELRALYLHRLSVSVVQRDHKVEEVALSQIVGGLLLEMGTRKLTAEAEVIIHSIY